MIEILEYLAILATGIIGIYSLRNGLLILQRRRDAKQQEQSHQQKAA